MLSFDWNCFTNIALDLQIDQAVPYQDQMNQAILRTCVSRTYYAAYNIALFHLGGVNGTNYQKAKTLLQARPPRSSGSHECVWFGYQRASIPMARPVGTLGFQLKSKRADADYVATIEHNSKTVTDAIRESNEILKIINRLVTSGSISSLVVR